ncbi:MAG: PD-(D/E)XK nuclease family protein [Acidimicrobiales bacterium]|nr:PD-(D/E)XK nuclease family protein [Acidimicrobiales bacterium]
MALPLPHALSPSKVTTFTDCALAFRFSAIDRLPEPPSLPATRGTLVHAALERLFGLVPEQRTRDAARRCLADASTALRDEPDLAGLGLDAAAEQELLAEADVLVQRSFELEDPTRVRPIGLELRLETEVDGLRLVGVIDRLELDDAGELVVTDYKSGAAPRVDHEQERMTGVHFYALLCERVFGRRPARVQLLYLGDPVALVTTPTEQSTRALLRKVGAVWRAVERACEQEDFRPRRSRLCDWCAFRVFCPVWGGDPSTARAAHRPPAEPDGSAGGPPST